MAMSSSLPATADPFIEELIRRTKQGDGKLCTTVETILQRLLEQNQAYKRQIYPAEVGIHPRNRDGGGVSWSHVHTLGSNLATLGFVWEECSHAVCVEDDSQMTIAHFTDKFLAAAHPHLAKANVHRIKYGSLSCSHTNQFLCAAAAAVPCNEPALIEGQRMSLAKICKGDPDMKEAMEKGLKWLVLKATAVKLYPALPDLIQAARNAPGQLHKPESQIQVMMRMSAMAKKVTHADGLPNWAAIHNQISKTCPRIQLSELASLQRFLQRWGGGDHAAHLKDLAKFWTSRVGDGRAVDPKTFDALAKLPLNAAELCPRVVTAIVKAQAVCSAEYAPGGIGKLITSAEILSLSDKKAAERKEANTILIQCRLALNKEATALSQAAKFQLLCDLDIHVGRAVTGKGTQALSTLQDRLRFVHVCCCFCFDLIVQACERAFYAALNKAFEAEGVKKLVIPPNADPDFAAQIEHHANTHGAAVVAFVQMDENGNPLQPELTALRSRGFSAGNCVEDSDGLVMTIENIAPNGAVTLSDGVNHVTKSCDEILAHYNLSKAAPEEYLPADACDPTGCLEHEDLILRGAVMLALQAVSETLESKTAEGIRVPATYNAVHATEKTKPKQLKLVPNAYTCKSATDARQSSRFTACVTVPTGKHTYSIVMPSRKQAVVPAWLVRHAATAEEANMEVSVVRFCITTGTKARTFLVDVPLLVNKKELQVNDELLLPPFTAALCSPVSHKRQQHAAIVLAESAASSSSSKRPKRSS